MQCDARVHGTGAAVHARVDGRCRSTHAHKDLRRAASSTAGAGAQILSSCVCGRIRRAKGAYKGSLCGSMHARVCRHTRRPTNALWPSITLFGGMRPAGQKTLVVKSRFVKANLCYFGLCLEGPCGVLST